MISSRASTEDIFHFRAWESGEAKIQWPASVGCSFISLASRFRKVNDENLSTGEAKACSCDELAKGVAKPALIAFESLQTLTTFLSCLWRPLALFHANLAL